MRKRSMLFRSFACLLLSVLLLLHAGVFAASAQVSVHRSCKTDSMRIALTFDDGPHPHQTEQILRVLDEYGVKATFFMVGVNVHNYPDAARAVVAAGHEVGNHTYSHLHLRDLNEAGLARELKRCEETIQEVCGCRPTLFRPPEGALNTYVEHCSEKEDYRVILWSLDTRDWECKSCESIVEHVLSTVKSGDIILMHDYIGHNGRTPEALAVLLPRLLARGFEPVTVSDLLAEEAE